MIAKFFLVCVCVFPNFSLCVYCLIFRCVRMFVCVCVYVCICVCCMVIYLYLHISLCVCECVCIYIYMCVCVCVCVCVCFKETDELISSSKINNTHTAVCMNFILDYIFISHILFV
eukprot:GHVR01167316.1.p1 GENE.GHVR01167316.1~~GHVR01167316.1.p1  ORF type:complete len:116 (+),score=48.09 GHVR01167316.1:3-350(+)